MRNGLGLFLIAFLVSIEGQGSCRQAVAGLPFQVPTAVVESLGNSSIYLPIGENDSAIPSPIVGWIPKYFSHGKRLRPLMVYLSGLAQGQTTKRVEPLAAIVELIHTGSLALDDVIDEAKERRGQPPLYLAEGRVAGMITGPWLQAYVQGYAEDVTTPAVRRRLSQVLREMGDGEILQDELKRRIETTGTYLREEYFRVAQAKTGALFGFSSQIVSLHLGATTEVASAWKEFGELLGVTYQMRDDFQDAQSEYGEINYAHLCFGERRHAPTFVRLDHADFVALIEEQTPEFQRRKLELYAILAKLEPESVRSESAAAAFSTLREMVDFVCDEK